MKELLTNEEIDTLLDMFRADGADAPGAGSDRGADEPVVVPLDLLKPSRLGREQIRALDRMFENVAKSIGEALSERLRIDVRCDCVAIEQLRLDALLGSIHDPTAIYELALPPLELPVLFAVTSGLLYGAVDRILGGTGKVQRIPNELSAAEYTVADAMVGPVLDRICRGLTELVATTWEIKARHANPGLAKVLPGQDVVLTAHFQVGAEHLVGDLRFALPHTAIERHLAGLAPGRRPKREPGAMRQAIGEIVQTVRAELAVVLGSAQLPLRQLLALRAGDVVPLDTRVGDALTAPVEGRPKFRGRLGTRGPRLAFQVGEVIA